ncbi:MAG: hypothetical protein MKZ70_06560, partial [Opitutales bacterium]|nr:hypothetical protein [Opitutales bacterium]
LMRSEERDSVVAAFEMQMDRPALKIYRSRNKVVSELLQIAEPIYENLSGKSEKMGIEYAFSSEMEKEGDFLETLNRNRKRDRYLQSTSQGPHRDDYGLFVNGLPASDYASEGQQRSITLALSLAIIQYWSERKGLLPVALADDAFAELDTVRRERFWEMLDENMQLIATGTQVPAVCRSGEWETVAVENGCFGD